MTSGYRLTPRAYRDLEHIASYSLQTWGSAQMETYLRQLADRFDWLAENPKAGVARDDVAKGYRCFPQGQHRIFYLMEPQGLAIIGIPHRAMDINRYFPPSES